MKKILFILNLMFLKCYGASELYQNSEELKEVLNTNMFAPSYPKMFLGLAFVIGLIYLTGIFYKRLTGVKLSNIEADKYKPEIISTTALGQNKNIHVIKVMNEYLLIGSTANSITFLKELEEVRTYKGY